MRSHEPTLRNFARRLAGDEGDDIAQDTLLAAWRALDQWRGDGSFAGWLRRIAIRRYFDRQRRAAPRSFTEFNPAMPAPDFAPDRRIAVDRALGTLQPRERAAALLVFGEGHTHVEAAAMLGVPLGTLKSIIVRARKVLVPLLEGADA